MEFFTQLTEEEFAELLRPKLRLFLSVDIVGSTAFKHSEKNQGWLNFFVGFFAGFDSTFQKARIDRRKKKNRNPVAEPILWKSLGDELVYVVELKHSADAVFYVSAFRDAVAEKIRYHTEGERELRINFKATAWLAGFPLGNAALPIRGDNKSISYDFIGPLLDTGFRLAKYSSPRRFTISVDLALLMLSNPEELRFYYHGREPLKGVVGNRGYPIIWIDMDDPDSDAYETLEDNLVNRNPVKNSNLRTFCEKFITQIGEPLVLPFIAGDTGIEALPEGYNERLDVLEKSLRKIFVVGEQIDEASEPDPKAADHIREIIARIPKDSDSTGDAPK